MQRPDHQDPQVDLPTASRLHVAAPCAIAGPLRLDELCHVRQVLLKIMVIDAESGSGLLHQPFGLPLELNRHASPVLG